MVYYQGMLESLAGQRLQSILVCQLFPKGDMGIFLLTNLLYLETIPGTGGLILSESCL